MAETRALQTHHLPPESIGLDLGSAERIAVEVLDDPKEILPTCDPEVAVPGCPAADGQCKLVSVGLEPPEIANP